MTIISTQYASGIVNATEKAAIAASKLIGLGDEKAADQVAVDAMRRALNDIDFKGRIVIGEGERDEAPMLYIGEEVGSGNNDEVDIALDPLEGTTITAKGMPNLFSDSCTIFSGVARSGSAIGQCRGRAVEKGGSTGIPGSTLGAYKYYLQNIEMYSGQSFRTTGSISPSANVYFNPLKENGQTVLKSTEENNLLFEFY